MIPFLIFLLLLFGYSLISLRVQRSALTAPIVFMVAGMPMCPALPAIRNAGVNSVVFLRVAELGMVLLLFTDASRTDLRVLPSVQNLPRACSAQACC